MTNLMNDSWQASVIKLAQTGNSRAIAFWMNHYLVPQGICAQVETEQPGCVVIRVVCRQTPETDRLVRFICHRLCKLNSDTLQQVRITAQVVGSPQILWEKSARLIPPSQRQQKKPVESIDPPSPLPIPEAVAANPAVSKAISQTGVRADTQSLDSKSAQVSRRTQTKQLQPQIKTQRFEKLRLHLPELQNPFLGVSGWQPNVQHRLKALKMASLDATDRSIRWFVRQKPATRTVLLGGSAVAAFLIGCSFELAGYYVNPHTFQQSKTSFTKLLRSTVALSGSVKTNSERIPVIQQPVPNPDDPAISLIFSNSATLTRLPTSQLASQPAKPDLQSQSSPSPSSSSTTPVITSIENFRVADMIVTNLADPLGSTESSTADQSSDKSVNRADNQSDKTSTGKTSTDKASTDQPNQANQTSQTDESAPPASGDELLLKQLPAADEDSQASNLDENERAKYSADDEAKSSAETNSEADPEQPQKKSNPIWPQELLANRVGLVNISSDAVMPKGADQLNQTLDLLQQNGIHAVGSGKTLSEARRPQVFDVKGQRIAYLGYSDSSTHAANASMAGVNVSLNKQMEEDIKAIRDQVDWIVINFSWNRELRAYPEEWQTSLAHAAIDYGADLVVGYDPTVIQGAEIYNGRAIVYSLGSSVDEYSDKPTGNYDTAALKVTLKEHIMELEFLPIQVKRGLAEVAKGDLGKTILNYFEQASSVFDQPLHSPTSINAQLRLSLPSAPDATMPTDPFIHYPSPASSGKN